MTFITKTTLLLVTARVFAVKARAVRLIYFLIAVQLLFNLPIQVIKIVICTPIASYWDHNIPSKHCLPQRQIFFLDTSLALAADLIILIIPIPLTWKLQMHWRRKLRVIALLGLGGIAVGATGYRAYLVVKFSTSEDVTGDFIIINLLV